jgi:hypothetical protein
MIKAAAALLFWLAVLLLQKFNWQLGLYKALVLLALLAGVPFVVAQVRPRGDVAAERAPRLLKAAALALLLVQVGYAATKLRHPWLIDAANVTIAEGQGLRAEATPMSRGSIRKPKRPRTTRVSPVTSTCPPRSPSICRSAAHSARAASSSPICCSNSRW